MPLFIRRTARIEKSTLSYAEKNKGGQGMKQILVSGILSALAILWIPSPLPLEPSAPSAPEDTVLWIEEAAPEIQSESAASEADADNMGSIRLLDGDIVCQLSMEDYLICVLLSEMPPEFELEALKAQAVAARTFTEKRRLSAKHENADVCSDSACCQAWHSEAALSEKFGAAFESYKEKARAAVLATQDEVLFYDGALIDATYFSCSSGKTEAAIAVWGTDIPYLQSVESFGEKAAPRYESETIYTASQLREMLPKAKLDGPPEGWFGTVSYTNGGGVDSMEIGGKAYSGTELRSLLGLNSTCFTVSCAGDTFTFSVRGYGHRVGMSQYGANYMAAQGFDYRTILQYYYRGTEIKKLSQTTSETAG